MTTSNANTHQDRETEPSDGDQRHEYATDRVDDVFDALANARRRHVLRYLATNQRTDASITALADVVADSESGQPSPDDVLVSLRHVHLPKLDAVGMIDYEPDRSRVRYETEPLVERLLERL